MSKRFCYKFTALFLALALLASALAACGGDGDETPPPLVTLDEQNPVKIGLLADWSGPFGIGGLLANDVIGLVEEQVRQMGGILENKPVKIEKADAQGTLADGIAAFREAVLQDKVSAIVGGGGGAVQGVVDSLLIAEELEVPYFNIGGEPADLKPYPFTVHVSALSNEITINSATDFIVDELSSRKAAFLTDSAPETRAIMASLKELLEASGVEVVYEGYPDMGTADFLPYLTDIRQAGADLIVSWFGSPSTHIALFTDIAKTGGWGDIDFLSLMLSSTFAVNLPVAEGTYHIVPWVYGLDYPGNEVFKQAFERKYGRAPNLGHYTYYLGLWTAIHAIELAGSDNPQDVAKAARSGLLTWESPVGLYKIDVNGEDNMTGLISVVRDGKLVPFEPE